MAYFGVVEHGQVVSASSRPLLPHSDERISDARALNCYSQHLLRTGSRDHSGAGAASTKSRRGRSGAGCLLWVGLQHMPTNPVPRCLKAQILAA